MGALGESEEGGASKLANASKSAKSDSRKACSVAIFEGMYVHTQGGHV